MSIRSLRRPRMAILLLLALAGTALAGTTAAGQAAASPPAASPPAAAVTGRVVEHVACPKPPPGLVRCMSQWRGSGQPSPRTVAAAVAGPRKGIRPVDIQKAYKLPKTGGKKQTIAIVDAYDDPKVESDLKIYRAAFKLPACSTANKCFRKVNQRGGKTYPAGDSGWGAEISLDVQAVSAVCPRCKILLVESDDNAPESLGTAVNTAVRLGATVVSNSYGIPEFNGIIALGKQYYTHKGVPIVASTGDDGFPDAEFPADLTNVWSIGGTFLKPTKAGGWTEDAAYFGSSACSGWIAKPSYQKDTHCGMRTSADISAVADSKDQFAVYDTYGLGSDDGWIAVSGTSLSAPLVAGMIGLAGNAVKAAKPSYAYAHRTGLLDVVGGSNGECGGDYLCNALKGYDAPTGLGSPRGLKAL